MPYAIDFFIELSLRNPIWQNSRRTMYPKVKVRTEEDEPDKKVHFQIKGSSLLLLDTLDSLSLQDDKEYTSGSSSPVAKVPKSYIPSFTTPSISISKEKDNKKFEGSRSNVSASPVNKEVEEARPNIKSSPVLPPRAVLSSPEPVFFRSTTTATTKNRISRELQYPEVFLGTNLDIYSGSPGCRELLPYLETSKYISQSKSSFDQSNIRSDTDHNNFTDNDGLIGSRNQLHGNRHPIMKKSNLGENTDPRGKMNTRSLKSKAPVNMKLGSKETVNSKSGLKEKQSPVLTVPKQSGYLSKGRQRSTHISNAAVLSHS